MHSSFPPTILLSLCFSIGLIVPTVIGRSLSLYSPTSLSSPLYRRATGTDPGHVQPQVDDLFRFLSKQYPSSGIKPRVGGGKSADKLKAHIEWINAQLLPKKEKLRILFIEYAGSTGDVGKSMTYADMMKSSISDISKTDLFSRMLYYLRIKKENKPNLEVKLAIDCNFLEYIPKETKDKWESDIKQCLANDPNNEAANEQKFMNVVHGYLKTWKPHIVIQGNAISKLYGTSEGFWAKFHKPMDNLVKQDLIVRINIRADFKQTKKVETKKEQYPISMADVVLVGQPADFFPGLPSATRQTRIGRPQVAGMMPIPAELKAWLDQNKKVMYLGLGGPQRSRELPKRSPSESLNKFMQEILKDPKYKEW